MTPGNAIVVKVSARVRLYDSALLPSLAAITADYLDQKKIVRAFAIPLAS
jgi:hypothetical protein